MDSKNIGALISSTRKELGMTQQALAERLGVTNKAVSKWETGDGYPEITIIPSIAETLGLSIDELLNGKKENISRTGQTDLDTLSHAEYIMNRSMLTFKNNHIISAGISILGVITAYTIRYSTERTALSCGLGLTLILTSMVYIMVSCNGIKNAHNKFIQLFDSKYPDFYKIIRNRLTFSIWVWVLSIALLSYALPYKIAGPYFDHHKSLIVFVMSAFIAAVTTVVVRIIYRNK